MATTFNDNIRLQAPKSLDDKYSVYEGGAARPYNNLEEVLTVLPVEIRSIGLTVLVGSQEFWFESGIQNENLVPKAVTLDNYYKKSESDSRYIQANPLTPQEAFISITQGITTQEGVDATGDIQTESNVFADSGTVRGSNVTGKVLTATEKLTIGYDLTESQSNYDLITVDKTTKELKRLQASGLPYIQVSPASTQAANIDISGSVVSTTAKVKTAPVANDDVLRLEDVTGKFILSNPTQPQDSTAYLGLSTIDSVKYSSKGLTYFRTGVQQGSIAFGNNTFKLTAFQHEFLLSDNSTPLHLTNENIKVGKKMVWTDQPNATNGLRWDRFTDFAEIYFDSENISDPSPENPEDILYGRSKLVFRIGDDGFDQDAYVFRFYRAELNSDVDVLEIRDSHIKIKQTPEYADNAAALADGREIGTVYRTGDLLKIVH